MTPIYLDFSATTPVEPAVLEAMLPYLGGAVGEPLAAFGNPASSHSFGRRARQALEDAREQIAQILGAYPDEVIFTSGATEANNLALFGLTGAPPGHILASAIEHPCIIEPLKELASRGFEVEWLPVGPNGAVPIEAISAQARADTRLFTLMLINHETGAVQPLATAVSRTPGPVWHTDAAQAVGKRIIRFHELGVSSLSASGHKFGAPKGIGLLLLRRDQKLHPALFGGHQQQGRRPGTEPVALAVALAKALQISHENLERAESHVRQLRSRFLGQLGDGACHVVNSPADGSPYVVNVSFPGCRADLLLMKLDLAGVACSTGSACSSGSLLPSPVLRAMQLPDELLRSAMRFSFSARTSELEVDAAASHIVRCVKELRERPL
jgi:cysteine desulfurase